MLRRALLLILGAISFLLLSLSAAAHSYRGCIVSYVPGGVYLQVGNAVNFVTWAAGATFYVDGIPVTLPSATYPIGTFVDVFCDSAAYYQPSVYVGWPAYYSGYRYHGGGYGVGRYPGGGYRLTSGGYHGGRTHSGGYHGSRITCGGYHGGGHRGGHRR